MNMGITLDHNDPLVIYVAGKYTPDVPQSDKDYCLKRDLNVYNNEKIGKHIMLKGHTPILPTNNTYDWEGDDRFSGYTHSDWLKHCLKILKKCDALFLCPGWEESKGAKIEYDYFCEFVKGRIFYNVNELPEV